MFNPANTLCGCRANVEYIWSFHENMGVVTPVSEKVKEIKKICQKTWKNHFHTIFMTSDWYWFTKINFSIQRLDVMKKLIFLSNVPVSKYIVMKKKRPGFLISCIYRKISKNIVSDKYYSQMVSIGQISENHKC